MKVIDFEAKRKERDEQKRYEDIESMVQLGQPDLFDKLIAREETTLTTDRESSCNQYIKFLQKIGRDPLTVFQEATFVAPMDFQADNGVDWLEAIEAALTFYAVLRKYDKENYDLALLSHPFL